MGLKLNNLAVSRLSDNITADAAFINVVDSASFPVLDHPDDWFPAALVNDMAQTEFVRVTGIDGNTLRVLRAQEGSIARDYSAGDVIELRLTLAALEELRILGGSP